jgi:chorismate dehydratase
MLRISAISYLNTAPLMWNFQHAAAESDLPRRYSVEYTLPSQCAQALAEGTADIGIIPVAAYATIPGLRILPDAAIASRDAVRSILLVSLKPLEQIRTVALDSSSRTSAALVQVLFAKHFKLPARFVSAPPQLESMLRTQDAALLIGDPALKVDRSRYLTWDLGQEWRAFTGKPFVFAFWAVRAGAGTDDELAHAEADLRRSRNAGLLLISEIADVWSEKLGLERETVISYLTHNIHYFLDPEYIEGMQLFFRYAAEIGVLPRAPELVFTCPEQLCNNSALPIRV